LQKTRDLGKLVEPERDRILAEYHNKMKQLEQELKEEESKYQKNYNPFLHPVKKISGNSRKKK